MRTQCGWQIIDTLYLGHYLVIESINTCIIGSLSATFLNPQERFKIDYLQRNMESSYVCALWVTQYLTKKPGYLVYRRQSEAIKRNRT